MNDEREEHISRAIFGKEVEQFMSSPIGRYLQVRAAQDKADAVKKFASLDPADHKGMQSAQQQYIIADNFEQWIGQAIRSGLQSLNVIEEMEG